MLQSLRSRRFTFSSYTW